MKAWKLSALIFALPVAAAAQAASDLVWTEAFNCHFTIAPESAKGLPVEGRLVIESTTAGIGSPSYKAFLQYLQPVYPPIDSTKVSMETHSDKTEIDQFLSSDIGQAMTLLARIPAEKKAQIASLTLYDAEHGTDENLSAFLLVFKDDRGQILGQSGTVAGMIPFGCDPR